MRPSAAAQWWMTSRSQNVIGAAAVTAVLSIVMKHVVKTYNTYAKNSKLVTAQIIKRSVISIYRIAIS